ncbi:MAG: PAS domain S-box protein [Ferruginibacter sp.]
MNQLVDFFSRLFDYTDWPSNWNSGSWGSVHGWTYIISELSIWSAYFILPILIIRQQQKSQSKISRLYYLLAVFFFAGGIVHFLSALSFWFPIYRFNTTILLLTGIISWVLVFYIGKVFPAAVVPEPEKIVGAVTGQPYKTTAEWENDVQLQTIYKNAPDAVIVINSKGFIVKWNPAAEKMFGWQEEEVLGKVLNEVIVPEEFRQEYIAEVKKFLKTGQSDVLTRTTMLRVLRKNNTSLIVDFTVSPVKIKDDFLFIGFSRDATERRKAEQAIKESEERYRLLTSEVHDYAIIMLSPEGNISSWNEGAQRIKGYTENEIIGKHFSVFHTTESIEKNLPAQELAIATKEGRYESEGWRVKKDGTLFWANVVITALKRGYVVIGFSKITRDNTERKKTEEQIRQLNTLLEQRVIERTEELQQSEKKYRKLFENSPMPMWVLEIPTMKFKDVNEAAIVHYGYSRKEFLSMTTLDIRPDDEKKRFLELDHSDTLGMRNTGIWKHLKKDGSIIYAEVNSHEMNIGNMTARLVLSVDITERKIAEERLEFALEAGRIGIWELDLINDISVRNLRHDQIFGYDKLQTDWGFKKLLAHIHPDDVIMIEESAKEALISKNWSVETKIIWQDLSVHWILITGRVTADAMDKPLKMMGTVLDITKHKQAEEEIRQLNNELEERVERRTKELHTANKELESFSYSVSHDLRAPLRAIHSYSQILLESHKTRMDDDGNRILTRVMFNAKKMERLIQDLLEFSRLGKTTLHKAYIDINKVVKDVIGDLGHSSKYHLNIKVGKLGKAIADEVTIRQVFQNLLMNATKYSSKKDDPIVEVGLIETDKGKTYFVKDNGAGFDMTYYNKMFDVFQRFHRQEEFEGTGVGLAIVHKIIQKHGGEIWAESVVDKGATFYFTLDTKKSIENGHYSNPGNHSASA